MLREGGGTIKEIHSTHRVGTRGRGTEDVRGTSRKGPRKQVRRGVECEVYGKEEGKGMSLGNVRKR